MLPDRRKAVLLFVEIDWACPTMATGCETRQLGAIPLESTRIVDP